MNRNPKPIIETDLELMEKLYELGDHTGAIMIARRLLMAHTLSTEEKRRIKRVIDGTKTGIFSKRTVLFVVILFVIVYIYLQFAS